MLRSPRCVLSGRPTHVADIRCRILAPSTMPRPSQRAIVSRSASVISAAKRKRRGATRRWEAPRSSSTASEESSSGSASGDEEVELSDAEDAPLIQPESG